MFITQVAALLAFMQGGSLKKTAILGIRPDYLSPPTTHTSSDCKKLYDDIMDCHSEV